MAERVAVPFKGPLASATLSAVPSALTVSCSARLVLEPHPGIGTESPAKFANTSYRPVANGVFGEACGRYVQVAIPLELVNTGLRGQITGSPPTVKVTGSLPI